MAFNPTLSDPQDVTRPIAPVTNNSVATAISGLSDILSTGANIYAKQAKMKADELNKKDSQSFRDEAEALQEEIIKDFRTKAGRMKKTSGADIRLQALYKRFKDNNPDKAAEYLKIMRETTGRNVAGAELKATLDEAQEYQNNLENQRDQYVKNATALGVPLYELDTERGASLYVALSENKIALLQQEQRLNYATNQRKLNQLDGPDELGKFGTTAYHDVSGKAETLVKEFTGVDYENLDDKTINNMNPEDLNKLRQSLLGLKDATLLDANNKFSRFDTINPSQINQVVKPTLDNIDSMLSRIDLETTKENAQNRTAIRRAAILAGLDGTALGTIMTLNPNMLKLNLSTKDTAKYIKALAEYANGVPLDIDDKHAVSTSVKTLENLIDQDKTDIPELNNIINSIRKGNLANFDDMSGKQRADMFEALKNDKVLDLIRNTDDKAVDVLVKNADEFAYQLIVSAAADINDDLGRRPMRAPLGSDKRSSKEFIDISIDSSGIKFSAKPGFTGEDRKIAMQTANDFTRLWGNKLNNALHVKSKLEGVSLEQNAKILIDNTPRLKSLMGEAE